MIAELVNRIETSAEPLGILFWGVLLVLLSWRLRSGKVAIVAGDPEPSQVPDSRIVANS
jgi:hypothetical protein